MSLFQDIQNGKYNLILIIIIAALFYHCYWITSEEFTVTTTTATQPAVAQPTATQPAVAQPTATQPAVAQPVATTVQPNIVAVYQSDLEAVKNVSNTATQILSDFGGLADIKSNITALQTSVSALQTSVSALQTYFSVSLRIPAELAIPLGWIANKMQVRNVDQEIASSGTLLVTYRSIIKPLSGTVSEWIGNGSGSNDNAWIWMRAFDYKPDMTDQQILYDGYNTRFFVTRNQTVTKSLAEMIPAFTVESGRVVNIKLYSRRDTDDDHQVYWSSLIFTQTPV